MQNRSQHSQLLNPRHTVLRQFGTPDETLTHPVGQNGSRRESPTRPSSRRCPCLSTTRTEFSACKERGKVEPALQKTVTGWGYLSIPCTGVKVFIGSKFASKCSKTLPEPGWLSEYFGPINTSTPVQGGPSVQQQSVVDVNL